MGIFNDRAFSQEQNCEEAKKKYLIENPDVAKAGMDAWAHYTYHGKKEGRKWPNCFTATELDNIIQNVQQLGSKSDLVSNYYTLQYIHQEFDFYEEPLPILDTKLEAGLGSGYAKIERDKLENLLKGLIELKKQDSIFNKELTKYPTFRVSEVEDYYKILNQNIQIIDFGSLWPQYAKKIKKACNLDFGYNFSGKFFKTTEKNELGHNYRKVMFSNTSIISPDMKIIKKLDNIINKAITIHPEIEKSENKQTIIENETGLNEEYFLRKKQLLDLKEKNKIVENYLFLNLPSKNISYSQISYIGNTKNGIPSGFGYLLNDQKQLIFAAHWDEGFPIILYKVNIFNTPEKNNKMGINYTYYGESFSKKYSNKYIDLASFKYDNRDYRSYQIYIGDYKNFPYEKNSTIIQEHGFGVYFYTNWEKNNKQYYVGYWDRGSKNGKGKQYGLESNFEGNFVNNQIISGSIYNRIDKSIYTGEIKDWRMNGEGKKVYANGKVEEGYFDNGSFKMSMKQYKEEKNRKEQQRIAEERKQEEIRKEEEQIRKEQENPISKHHDYIKNRLFQAISVKIYLKNDKESDEIYDDMVESLENYKLDRKLTKRDEKYIEKVMNEIVAEHKMAVELEQKMKNDNRIEKCKWCPNKYNTYDGYILRNESNCEISEQKTMDLVYKSTLGVNSGSGYCSQKCAKCACLSKKGINCEH